MFDRFRSTDCRPHGPTVSFALRPILKIGGLISSAIVLSMALPTPRVAAAAIPAEYLWARNSPGGDSWAPSMALDAEFNVYVVGTTFDKGAYWLATTKYNRNGVLQWTQMIKGWG